MEVHIYVNIHLKWNTQNNIKYNKLQVGESIGIKPTDN
jgi:hypothetical protein